MDDQVVSAELEGADDLVAKGDDGIFPLARVGRGEIDQIVGVDGDRAKAKRCAALAETLSDGSGDGALVRARPHARAAGENLQRGATDARCGVQCAAGFAGDGGVNADAGAAVEPGRGGNEGEGRVADGWRIDLGGLRIGHRAVGWIQHVSKRFCDREIILAEGLRGAQSLAGRWRKDSAEAQSSPRNAENRWKSIGHSSDGIRWWSLWLVCGGTDKIVCSTKLICRGTGGEID